MFKSNDGKVQTKDRNEIESYRDRTGIGFHVGKEVKMEPAPIKNKSGNKTPAQIKAEKEEADKKAEEEVARLASESNNQS